MSQVNPKLVFPNVTDNAYRAQMQIFRLQLQDMASWVTNGPIVTGVSVSTQIAARKAALKAQLAVLTTYVT